MENEKNGMEKEFKPGLAESFEIEMLNVKGKEITDAIGRTGDFVFGRSGTDNEGKVYFEGERSDGTKIRVEIVKGKNYQSPAELNELNTNNEK